AGGRYYYQEILAINPLFGPRPSERRVSLPTRGTPKKAKLARAPSARTPPLTMEGLGAWVEASFTPDNAPPPLLAVGPASMPSSAPAVYADGGVEVSPGSSARYGGIDPRPWVQVGADFRALGYFPADPNVNVSFFPMQTDIYLAGTPYNPDAINQGRLTFLVNGGILGRREGDVSTIVDRMFLREWYALFYDLPYQIYAKVGQFIPAYGWRLDDHTAFIRQNNTFNNERQVTGIEVGINPNYPYAHLSVYIPGPPANRIFSTRNQFAVIDGSDGFGSALSAGWRDLGFHLGGSVLFETRDVGNEFMVGANWGFNFHHPEHPWPKIPTFLPIIYLGEFDFRKQAPEGSRDVDSLSAFHEVNVVFLEGLFGQVKYDWIDPDLLVRDDELHRLTFGVQVFPITYMELNLQARLNLEPNDQNNNEFLAQLHLFY
ncbi:MAG: hypothetical protein AAFU79_15595, partial [Myxococcota bacterium]